MLQSVTECYRVLQSVRDYYRVLQSISSASTWSNFWACFLGTAVAHKESQEVVRSDVETGEKHVGCYYGV